MVMKMFNKIWVDRLADGRLCQKFIRTSMTLYSTPMYCCTLEPEFRLLYAVVSKFGNDIRYLR